MITSELIQDVAAGRILEAAKYVSGVSESTLPTSWERTNVRGFLADRRTVDGFTYSSYPSFFADDVYRFTRQHEFRLFFMVGLWKGPSMRLASAYNRNSTATPAVLSNNAALPSPVLTKKIAKTFRTFL